MTITTEQAKREKLSGKYGRVPRWVSTNTVMPYLSGNEVKVLVCLCDKMSNEENTTWITRSEISQITGVCFSSISRITADLAIYQIISKKQHGGRNKYGINLNAPEWWINGGAMQNQRRAKAKEGRRTNLKINFSFNDITDTAETTMQDVPP